MVVRFRDLGPLRIERDGVEVGPGGQKPGDALSLLLIHLNQRVSVDALMDAMWSGVPGLGSVSTLESHIYRLRRVLEPDRQRGAPPERLVNDAGGYRLLATPEEVDSQRLLALAEDARALLATGDPHRALRRTVEATELWRGVPYAESADADWAAPAVARLQEAYDQIQEDQVDALLETGQAEPALVKLQALLPAHPLRERLWGQLMLAQYRCHRPEDALATFRRARATMLDELGVEPGPQLQRLHQQMLERDPDLEATQPARAIPAQETTHLPRRTSPLIGRDHELAALSRHVEETSLITIAGAGGCGKTKLAIEVARRSAAGFPDGVWFVDLASVETPDLVVDLVVSTIGLQPAAVGTPLQALRSYTRDRRMLVVLDNCEHVISTVYELCAELVGDDAAVHILATSREPIGLDSEVIWSLPPLEVPTAENPEAPALELFLSRLRAAAPALELSEADRDRARTICVVLDGLPLAVELAAARIRSATLEEIVEQATTAPGALARTGPVRHPAHRTLRDNIEWSVRLMDSHGQLLHTRLAALPGTFTAQAAAATDGYAPLDPGEVAGLLDSLVHRSLLVASRSTRAGGVTLYRQLASVRDHAAHALQVTGTAASAVASRHAWILELLGRRPPIGRADTHGWYDEIDDNFAAVRATLQHTLVDEPDPLAGYLLSRISNFWYYRTRMVEATRWLELAVPAPEGTDPTDARMVELSLAGLYGMRGRFDLARPLIADATDHFGRFPLDRLADVIEHFASLALVAMLHQEHDLIAVLDNAVQVAAGRYPSEGLHLVAESLACITGLQSVPIDTSRARADDVYQRSVADGSLLAAWLACTAQTVVARLNEDPQAGIVWSDRLNDLQLQLGARPEAFPLENRASLVAVTGSARTAVELFSASRVQSRRVGLSWPLLPTTQSRLDGLRETLGVEAFDEAWRSGAQRTAAEAWTMARSDSTS